MRMHDARSCRQSGVAECKRPGQRRVSDDPVPALRGGGLPPRESTIVKYAGRAKSSMYRPGNLELVFGFGLAISNENNRGAQNA